MNPHIVYVWEDMLQQWVAWDDSLGADTSPYGYGATRQEAAEDLEWQLEELETPTTPDRSVYAS
jgi:hypothetical protein